jgi:hypothetical protein
MIDEIALLLKIALFMIGGWQIAKRNLRIAFVFMAFGAVMAGVDIGVGAEQPWTLFVSGEAVAQDYKEAVWGGAIMLLILILIFWPATYFFKPRN